jgi:hypothetical protein
MFNEMKIQVRTAMLICLLVTALSISCYSQTLQWAYQHTNINWNYNIGKEIVTDNSGNVYVTGRKFSNGNEDILTHKIGPGGNLLWAVTFNGNMNSNDYGCAIAADNNQNVYVAGAVRDSVTNYYDIAVIKYDANGNMLWVKKYNGPGSFDDIPKKIAVDIAGNVFVAGTSYGDNTDYAVIKYNSAGLQQWVYRYSGALGGADELYDMKLDNGGDIIVTGSSIGTGSGLDYATIKIYNSSGLQAWVSRYFNNEGGGIPDEAASLDIAQNGDVYVTGSSYSINNGMDIFTQKYSGSTGAQQWSRRYIGTGNAQTDLGKKIVSDKYGNAFVIGTTYISNEANKRTSIIKYDSFGNEQWVKTHVTNVTDEDPVSAAVDTAGNLYIEIQTFENNVYEYKTVKYISSNGITGWEQDYSVGYNSFPSALTVDKQFNVYVTGQLGSKSGTIKYSQNLVGIHANNNNVADKFSLEQNFPNPFNPSTTIGFSITGHSFVKITVYDITGKLVSTLLDESKNAGLYTIVFNAANLSSGTYFYKIETDVFSEVKKMLLVK